MNRWASRNPDNPQGVPSLPSEPLKEDSFRWPQDAMEAGLKVNDELSRICRCGDQSLPEGGYMVAGGIEHRRGFCRAQELPEWWPR